MLVEHLLQGLGEIAQEMPAIGDLRGGGRPLTRPIGVGGRAVTRDHLDARMCLEPLRQGVGGAIREQRHGLPALQIDQDRPIALAFPQGEIVDPEHRRGGERWHRMSAQPAQQSVPAHRQVPAWPRCTPALPPSATPSATGVAPTGACAGPRVQPPWAVVR